ncbi:hypothetical protein [Burkholderia cenocepacia]|uniref:hypothetical protein n=1 Tax=Burkholderia cenocepacia TaxID=95486 RepID=UPI000A948289|nr:hypothetical protein [Burkholderia cenocepacia]
MSSFSKTATGNSQEGAEARDFLLSFVCTGVVALAIICWALDLGNPISVLASGFTR